MSAYNAEDTIERALRSVFAQTYKDFEVVVVNDGSNDLTGDILRRLALENHCLKVIEQGNKGLTASLNGAIDSAVGEYIVRQDADDVSLPNRLEKIERFLRGSGSVSPDIVFTQAFEISSKARCRVIPRSRYYGSEGKMLSLLRFGNFIVHGTLVIRRSLLLAQPYDERWRYAQDYELLLRLMRGGAKVGFIAEPLYEFHRHSSSISSKKRTQQNQCAVAAVKLHLGTDRLLIANRTPLAGAAIRCLREFALALG